MRPDRNDALAYTSTLPGVKRNLLISLPLRGCRNRQMVNREAVALGEEFADPTAVTTLPIGFIA